MELFEGVHALAGSQEFDWDAGHFGDGQRRAAARVPVHFRQRQARQRDSAVEFLRDRHGFLPGHGVENQNRLGGADGFVDGFDFVHKPVVYLESSGGVDNRPLGVVSGGGADAFGGDFDGVARSSLRVNAGVDLAREGFELVYRRRALEVGGDERGGRARLRVEMPRELGGERRLARAVEPGDDDDRRPAGRRRRAKAVVAAGENGGQLLVGGLDDNLTRGEARPHRFVRHDFLFDGRD